MSLKLTSFLNKFSAMFFTPTFDWAIIQHGSPRDSHIAAAPAIVVVFPVPGGPMQSRRHWHERPTAEGSNDDTMNDNQ
jgi:hypothetical protein